MSHERLIALVDHLTLISASRSNWLSLCVQLMASCEWRSWILLLRRCHTLTHLLLFQNFLYTAVTSLLGTTRLWSKDLRTNLLLVYIAMVLRQWLKVYSRLLAIIILEAFLYDSGSLCIMCNYLIRPLMSINLITTVIIIFLNLLWKSWGLSRGGPIFPWSPWRWGWLWVVSLRSITFLDIVSIFTIESLLDLESNFPLVCN